MQLPLTVAILALLVVIGVLARMYVQAQSSTREAYAEMLRVSKEYSDQALKLAADSARLQPKYADKMLESLTRSIQDATKASSDAMVAIYGPVRVEEQRQVSEYDDLPTPWYAAEGSLDTTDPTDGLLVSDPTEYTDTGGGLDGALMVDGDDEPFGIPGLKVGG